MILRPKLHLTARGLATALVGVDAEALRPSTATGAVLDVTPRSSVKLLQCPAHRAKAHDLGVCKSRGITCAYNEPRRDALTGTPGNSYEIELPAKSNEHLQLPT